eukprot:TRINITY_DN470_c0_g4_i1.p2 TRINITY_DN470_c0_g4~~TRINITY_DN470_c0_g4_i1.p2  ORF type:complete len:144 (+),score=5.07 TRINITY_DN470_c0_g4_i1:956-1387(+)
MAIGRLRTARLMHTPLALQCTCILPDQRDAPAGHAPTSLSLLPPMRQHNQTFCGKCNQTTPPSQVISPTPLEYTTSSTGADPLKQHVRGRQHTSRTCPHKNAVDKHHQMYQIAAASKAGPADSTLQRGNCGKEVRVSRKPSCV